MANSMLSPASTASFILCRLATWRIAAETMAAGEEPPARALPNSVSVSAVRPAKAASITPSSASAEASATTAMHVVEFDALLALGVERELAHFVARGEPVAAEQRQQRGACVRRDGQVGGAHFVVDQPAERALVVGIAGQRGGDLRLLAQRAQRRVAFADRRPR